MSRSQWNPTVIDELDAAAFVSLCSYAASDRRFTEAFTKSTGCAILVPRTGLDRMIDEATGVDQHACITFMRWVASELWGKPMPRLVAEVIQRKTAT